MGWFKYLLSMWFFLTYEFCGLGGHRAPSEKAMALHSSTLAWQIPWTEEPGALQSMGLRRVGHDWATSLSLFTFMHWRRKWQPTPVFLPGESQGRGSLMGWRLWGRAESDTTEVTEQQQQGTLVPPPGIESMPPAVEAWSPNYLATGKSLNLCF